MIPEMMKVSACALTAVVLGAVLKKHTPELALLLAVTAGLWMLGPAVRSLSAVTDLMGELAGLARLPEVLLEPVLKAVLLSILTRITAELCRSAGEGGTAAFVEAAGTALALTASLPLVRAVVELFTEMLI